MSPRDKAAKEQQKRSEKAGEEAAQTVADRTGVGEAKTDPDAIREDIEQTREELGETVDALSEKADVKGQAKAAVDDRKQAVRDKQEQAKEKVSELRGRVAGATPEDVKGAASQAAATAQERPGQAVAVAFAVGFVFAWLIKRR